MDLELYFPGIQNQQLAIMREQANNGKQQQKDEGTTTKETDNKVGLIFVPETTFSCRINSTKQSFFLKSIQQDNFHVGVRRIKKLGGGLRKVVVWTNHWLSIGG
jgi:hypothetical protein